MGIYELHHRRTAAPDRWLDRLLEQLQYPGWDLRVPPNPILVAQINQRLNLYQR